MAESNRRESKCFKDFVGGFMDVVVQWVLFKFQNESFHFVGKFQE